MRLVAGARVGLQMNNLNRYSRLPGSGNVIASHLALLEAGARSDRVQTRLIRLTVPFERRDLVVRRAA
jgi:hypothetical protein